MSLSKDLEPWVSGKQGFVVFTLGTSVKKMPDEITRVFLEAFRQIPQKVDRRHFGDEFLNGKWHILQKQPNKNKKKLHA